MIKRKEILFLCVIVLVNIVTLVILFNGLIIGINLGIVFNCYNY